MRRDSEVFPVAARYDSIEADLPKPSKLLASLAELIPLPPPPRR